MDELELSPISRLQANEASARLLEIMEDGIANQQKALSIAYKALYWIANGCNVASENEALTLGKLQKMDGEPVWIVQPNNSNCGHWKICYGLRKRKKQGKEVIDFGNGYLEYCEEYGKMWLAYTRKYYDSS